MTTTPTYDFTALNWLVRVCTPAWLDAANLTNEASALRALPPIESYQDVEAVAAPLRNVQMAAYRRSGVISWAEVDGIRPYGALAAKNASDAAIHGSHMNPDYRLASCVAGYAWTAATYAAHAVGDEQCEQIAAGLARILPRGVDA